MLLERIGKHAANPKTVAGPDVFDRHSMSSCMLCQNHLMEADCMRMRRILIAQMCMLTQCVSGNEVRSGVID